MCSTTVGDVFAVMYDLVVSSAAACSQQSL